MENRRPVEQAGKWIFHLQHEHSLQLRIASLQEAGDQILIEGHEISELLDYLYDHRDLVYEATHNQERRRAEALEISNGSSANGQERHRVEPTRYFDDGVRRTRATSEHL